MQEYKRRKKASADKNTAAAAGGAGDPPPTVADGKSEAAARNCSDEKDVFYEKLQKLNESSGFSLIINLRETSLDLYRLYKEVTIRGGFHQVTKDGKWDEIGGILKGNDNKVLISSPTQLQNVYKSVLHQFEQMHHYRTPGKPSPSFQQDNPNGLRREKRHYKRSSPSLLLCSNNLDSNYQLSKGPKTPELKPILQTSTNDKELKKERYGPEPPVKARTAYQLYLKMECDRFKNAHRENSVNQKMRDKIIDTWRHLSESQRKPYVDASNKDKERYNLQMAAYKEHKSKSPPSNQSLCHDVSTQSETKSCQSWFSSSAPRVINFGSSSLGTYGDYYVTLQGDDVVNEVAPADKSLVDSTIEMLKGAHPGDPMFQLDWDYSF